MKLLTRKNLTKLFFLFGLLIIPHFAHAAFLDFLNPISLISLLFNGIGSVLQYTIGNLFILAGQLTNVVFNLNIHILESSGNFSIINAGWTITRDIANLGFVLLVIIMALATVVRYEEYGVRKLLPKLIAMAIIVNFSLAGAGLLVQFSNTITSFFLDKAATGQNLSTAVAGVLKPQQFILGESDPLPPDPADQGGALSSLGTAFLTSMSKLIFGIAFTLVATIIMLMLAFMFFLRYLALIFLFILVPIVCLFYVFPGLKKYWDMWWDSFNKWVFFAPAVSFFIYLSLAAAKELSSQKIDLNGSFSLGKILQDGINLVVIGGLLLGSIIAAQKLGIAGSGAALGAVKGLGNGAKGWIKNRAQITQARLGKTRLGVKTSEAAETTKEKLGTLGGGFKVKDTDKFGTKVWKRAANFATGLTGLRGAARGVSGEKNFVTTKSGKKIENQSLFGSLIKSAVSGSGIIKEKKGKDEKKEETKEDFEKKRDELSKTKSEFQNKGIKTAEIDAQIRDLNIKIGKKIRDEVELEFSGKGSEDIDKKIKELTDNTGDEKLKKMLDEKLVDPVSKLDNDLVKLDKQFESMLSGDKARDGTKLKAVENVGTLNNYLDAIKKRIKDRETSIEKETEKTGEKLEEVINRDNTIKVLNRFKTSFENKIKQKQIELGALYKQRENILKNEKQKESALGKEREKKGKESK